MNLWNSHLHRNMKGDNVKTIKQSKCCLHVNSLNILLSLPTEYYTSYIYNEQIDCEYEMLRVLIQTILFMCIMF